MRFFIISQSGEGNGLVLKLKNEGHEVFLYFKNSAARKKLKGMVDQVLSIPIGLEKLPDAVIFDSAGMGKEADRIKKLGYRVIGGGEWNDKLKLNPSFAMKAMSSFGIKAPMTYAFDSIGEAIAFIDTQKKLLVYKAEYTYIPKTNQELASHLLNLKLEHGVDTPCILQEFIEGEEVSTEIWYAKGKVVANPIGILETKNFMVGDVGPYACQNSCVFAYPNREPKIVQQSLKKIHRFVEHIEYTGPLSICGIVKNGKFYGLYFTPSFNYPSLYAFMRILDEPLGEFLVRIAKGENTAMKLKGGYGVTLKVSIPPYPGKGGSGDWCVDEIGPTVFPLDVYLSEGKFYTVGYDGAILECTGYNDSLYEADKEAQGSFKRLVLHNKQARIGDSTKIFERCLDGMSSQGYEMPPFTPLVSTIITLIPIKETIGGSSTS